MMDVDQVPRKEKKSSKDKVKKSKKAEKPKTETDSVDESSKVGLTSPEEQAPEMELAHRSNTVRSITEPSHDEGEFMPKWIIPNGGTNSVSVHQGI